MLSETEFTINEVAKAFHRPAFWIRRWIRKGRLQGYLLGGILEDRVEAEALVEFQERNPRYQRAVMSLLKESVRNLVSLEAHASLDKTSICRNLLLILGIFWCRIFLLLLV